MNTRCLGFCKTHNLDSYVLENLNLIMNNKAKKVILDNFTNKSNKITVKQSMKIPRFLINLFETSKLALFYLIKI